MIAFDARWPWPVTATCAFDVLLGASLRALLILLFLTGIALPVSSIQRYLAMAIAVVQGGNVAVISASEPAPELA